MEELKGLAVSAGCSVDWRVAGLGMPGQAVAVTEKREAQRFLCALRGAVEACSRHDQLMRRRTKKACLESRLDLFILLVRSQGIEP